MEAMHIDGGQLQVSLTRAELLIVNAALNEICNGIEVFEFETRIGAPRGRVSTLLENIGALLDRMESLGREEF